MSPLAVLYSTSTMEHHHLDQCMMILSEDSNNILQVSLIIFSRNAWFIKKMSIYFHSDYTVAVTRPVQNLY